MARFARLTPLLVALLCLPNTLTGCAGRADFTDELRAVVAHTAGLARHFVYTEKHAGHIATVTGTIEDDFRYNTAYQFDGTPELSEVWLDDMRALRVDDATLFDRLAPGATGTKLAQVGSATSMATVSDLGIPAAAQVQTRPAPVTLDALRRGSWVLDQTGSGPLRRVQISGQLPELGLDQVKDGLSVLRYLTDSLGTQGGQGAVVRYNPESLDYRGDLDPFPRPDIGAGETRYDFVLFGLGPRANTVNTTPEQREAALPGPAYFRNLSVYVKGGLVETVRESVSITRRLKDPDQDILSRFDDLGKKVPDQIRNGSPELKAAYIHAGLTLLEFRRKVPPLRLREMTLTLTAVGDKLHVSAPDAGTAASLAGVLPRGLILDQGT